MTVPLTMLVGKDMFKIVNTVKEQKHKLGLRFTQMPEAKLVTLSDKRILNELERAKSRFRDIHQVDLKYVLFPYTVNPKLNKRLVDLAQKAKLKTITHNLYLTSNKKRAKAHIQKNILNPKAESYIALLEGTAQGQAQTVHELAHYVKQKKFTLTPFIRCITRPKKGATTTTKPSQSEDSAASGSDSAASEGDNDSAEDPKDKVTKSSSTKSTSGDNKVKDAKKKSTHSPSKKVLANKRSSNKKTLGKKSKLSKKKSSKKSKDHKKATARTKPAFVGVKKGVLVNPKDIKGYKKLRLASSSSKTKHSKKPGKKNSRRTTTADYLRIKDKPTGIKLASKKANKDPLADPDKIISISKSGKSNSTSTSNNTSADTTKNTSTSSKKDNSGKKDAVVKDSGNSNKSGTDTADGKTAATSTNNPKVPGSSAVSLSLPTATIALALIAGMITLL